MNTLLSQEKYINLLINLFHKCGFSLIGLMTLSVSHFVYYF